jgi:hypothetical protein
MHMLTQPGAGARDPHDVLGVPRGADRRQITRAFHRRSLRGGHPDTGGDAKGFEELARARDLLLGSRPRAARKADPTTRSKPSTSATSPIGAQVPTPHTSPSPGRRPVSSRMNKLAVVSILLVFLGPLFWIAAIAVGHVALRQIRRTGQGGGTLVPVVLTFLHICTLPALVPIAAALAAG